MMLTRSTRQRSTWRPRLETLEDRTVPTAGALDSSFGTGGLVVTDINSQSNVAKDLVVQPDGKILAGGYAYGGPGSYWWDFGLVRYNANGSLDTSFGSKGVVTTDFRERDEIAALALQPDGKIVAVGTSAKIRSDVEYRLALARYLPNGALDKSFGKNGTVLTSGVGALGGVVIQPDGKIVVAGGTQRTNGDFLLARYTASGALDPTFGSGGLVVTDFGGVDGARKLLIQPDGKLVVVGTSSARVALARYNPNGALDPSFGVGGKVTLQGDGELQGMQAVLDSAGRIVVSAQGFSEPDGDCFAVARFQGNGSLDTTFGGGLVYLHPPQNGSMWAPSLGLQSDGKIVVGGTRQFTAQPGGVLINDFALARLNGDGGLDSTFGTDGWVTTDFGTPLAGSPSWDNAQALRIQPDGKVLMAGWTGSGATNSSSSENFALARYLGDDPPPAAAALAASSAVPATGQEPATPTVGAAHRRAAGAGPSGASSGDSDWFNDLDWSLIAAFLTPEEDQGRR